MIETPYSEPDYYAVLRVAPDATPAEIERAYRALAGSRTRARWRPGRAARELAMINAAYGILGYPERRADYDRRRAEAAARAADGESGNGLASLAQEPALVTYRPQAQARRQLPRVQLGRPSSSSPADAVIIVLVVVVALFIGSMFVSRKIDLSAVQNFGETVGLTSRRRPAPTASAPPTAATVPTPAALAEAKPSPAPATATPAEPPAPLGALPTAVAGQRFAGSQVTLSDAQPARQSELTVTLKLVREGQPVPNANVYLTAHYRTVDERQPPGPATVKTDANGVAAIAFNIGDATPGYRVNLDVTALVEGQQVVFQTSFTPR
jgi:hypothetical protein